MTLEELKNSTKNEFQRSHGAAVAHPIGRRYCLSVVRHDLYRNPWRQEPAQAPDRKIHNRQRLGGVALLPDSYAAG